MSKVVVSRKIKINPPNLHRFMSIREFYEKRNKILILRTVGGLGDILMHRMLFEDFKKLSPECEIHFACPKIYHDAVKDHPYIDQVLDSDLVDKNDYIISYNTSTACARYEMKIAPNSDFHRADIWAAHCGLSLTSHEMHIRLTPEEQKWGKSKVNSIRKENKPVVAIAPVSAMGNKNLNDEQNNELLKGIIDMGLTPFGLHSNPILSFSQMDVPVIYKINIREWMSIIAASDYVISVDTAAFHCAGGFKKPVTGIFTFCNGKTYSKHYPKVELVQGPCPVGYGGCYNWCSCPVKNNGPLPCCSNIKISDILNSVERMVRNHPTGLMV